MTAVAQGLSPVRIQLPYLENGTARRMRQARCCPTRWRWRRRRATARRRSGWCCIEGSAAAGSSSIRTTTAARRSSCSRTRSAAFVFHWPLIERQVRGEGRVERLTRRESDRYFQRRPRESRLSAWASPQSAEISGATVSRSGVRAIRSALQRERTFRVHLSGAASELWQIVSSSGRDNLIVSTIALFFDEKEIPGRISG